jgi:hypothetical protein
MFIIWPPASGSSEDSPSSNSSSSRSMDPPSISSSERSSSWCSSGLRFSRFFLDGVLSSLISSFSYAITGLVFSVFDNGFPFLKLNSLFGAAVSGTLKGLVSCCSVLGNCLSSIVYMIGYKSSCAKILFYLGTFILLFIYKIKIEFN